MRFYIYKYFLIIWLIIIIFFLVRFLIWPLLILLWVIFYPLGFFGSIVRVVIIRRVAKAFFFETLIAMLPKKAEWIKNYPQEYQQWSDQKRTKKKR